jgi:hypothetical protein
MTELQSLQNAADNVTIGTATVHKHYFEDRRKTTNKYFLTINGTSCSPILDYEQMNHFILGMLKAISMTSKQLINETD